jgi:hypothetical protein
VIVEAEKKEPAGAVPARSRRGDPSRFPTKGRPKGTKNKYSKLRDSLLDAFEQTGGTKELVAWGSQPRNRKEFYKLIVSILPKNIDIDGPGLSQALQINVVNFSETDDGE